MMRFLHPVFSLVIVLAIWAAVSASQVFPEAIFPTPQSVVVAAVDLYRDGTLLSDLKD